MKKTISHKSTDNEYMPKHFDEVLAYIIRYLIRTYGHAGLIGFRERVRRKLYKPFGKELAYLSNVHCTDFIPVYNELFWFLHKIGGKAGVVKFWEALSDAFLGKLRRLAKEKGLEGCIEYWDETLKEEAADVDMIYDEEKQEIIGTMYNCPSKGRLLREPHITPYPDYCEHCQVLYSRALAPYGISFEVNLTECNLGNCITKILKL